MRKLYLLLLCMAILLSSTLSAFAHSGRTDSSGGHWNRSTNTYHYHNGGYTSSNPSTYSSSGSSGTKSSNSETTAPKTESPTAKIKKAVESNFDNKVIVIDISSLSEYEAAVTVRTKLDLTGFDTENLVFYNYDKETSKYHKIKDPNYSFDEDGILKFKTNSNLGYVIISDGALTRK